MLLCFKHISKDFGLTKSFIILLSLLAGPGIALSAAPLGAPPQFDSAPAKAQKLKDGKSIVIGSYENRQQADRQLNALLDIVDGNSKLVNLELQNGFDYAIKEEEGMYTVSVEPFIDDDVLNDVLLIVQIHYPKARATECKGCVREELLLAKERRAAEQEQELIENAIAFEENSSLVAVSVEEDHAAEPEKPRVQEGKPAFEKEKPAVEQASDKEAETAVDAPLPFKMEYLLYGVGALALIGLIFLLMRKPKKTTDKELKELYAQAKKLEQEMEAEAGEHAAAEVEEAVAPAEEVVIEEEPPLQAAPVVEEAPVVQEEPVVEEAPAAAKPKEVGELNHKLREPNTAIGNITKDNFKEFEGLRLLIAEDNLINQKVIVGLLKDSGINVKIANDGQECLDILAEDANYPIILMDAHMPRVDGLEATRLIRANPAYDHITVMALSGDTGADDIRRMRDAGMEEQLEKPLKVGALYQALYCYFDPDNIGGPADELPEIHLDNSLGLEMLGGDIELYHEILAEFQSLYHDSDEKIELWLKHDDFDRAKALLLDVKGIGESIGTAELTQTAEEFREAIIAGEADKFPALMNRYRSHLKSILADIAEV